MEALTHINEGMVKIHVDLTGSTIENYDMSLGRKRVIGSCDLQAVQRVVKDVSMMENKAKYTIFYGVNGKEKRFGGMGFALEGNASDPSFQVFIETFQSKLPANVVWQDKAEAKAAKASKTGEIIFPIAAYMSMPGYTMPSHSGMRNVIVGIQSFAALVCVFISLVAFYSVLNAEQNLAMTIFSLVLGVGMLIYPILLAKTAFSNGGLHCVILSQDTLKINHAIQSVELPIKSITNFRNRMVELTIMQQGAKSTSIEYEFQINEHKFNMGENAALKFIEKATEYKLCIV